MSCSQLFTERSSKQLRTCPLPTSEKASNRYLDTLPDEVLPTVLRNLSCRPQHDKWQAYISADSVNTALDVGRALARAAVMEFRIIGGMNGVGLPPLFALDVSILRSLVCRLPLHKIVFQFPSRPFWRFTPKETFHKVHAHTLLSDLLRGCGAELRELVLDTVLVDVTEKEILAISTHCAKLSSLAIRSSRLKGSLTPIWRSLGSTLTRLYISRYTSNLDEKVRNVISVGDLVEHCVNLCRVDMYELDYETADIVVPLGIRIRVLSIEQPSFRDHGD